MTKRHDTRRIPPWGIGLIAVVLTAFAFYLGFAKRIPFTPHGYTIKAVFKNAQNIRVKSAVREAGVNVGKVSKVEHLVTDGKGQQAAVVEMELTDDARPIKTDATMQLRPRLFLEGNLFVDLHPGTPQASELKDGGTIPLSQTSTSVQLDQVLTSLQAPVRADLQTFLIEFGNGLDVYGGGEGLRTSFKTSPDAYRYTAEVNQATLGTQPGDLAGLIVNLDSFVRALDQNEGELKDLVTNLATVLSAFGKEDDALEAAIFELPRVLSVGRPALVSVNNSLPSLRAFAREALPGTKSAGPALDAATPFISQLRQLVGVDELRGLVSDLKPTVPSVANLSNQTIPFFEQARALSSCFNHVIIPWGDTPIPNGDAVATGDGPAGPVYKETGWGLAGLAGESRSGDANGQYIRVGTGGGTNTISTGNIPGLGPTFGQTQFALEGAEPPIDSSAKTPFNPGAPCENQDPPNLSAGAIQAVPGQSSASKDELHTPATLEGADAQRAVKEETLLQKLGAAVKDGKQDSPAAQQAWQELHSYYKQYAPEYFKAYGGGGKK